MLFLAHAVTIPLCGAIVAGPLDEAKVIGVSEIHPAPFGFVVIAGRAAADLRLA